MRLSWQGYDLYNFMAEALFQLTDIECVAEEEILVRFISG